MASRLRFVFAAQTGAAALHVQDADDHRSDCESILSRSGPRDVSGPERGAGANMRDSRTPRSSLADPEFTDHHPGSQELGIAICRARAMRPSARNFHEHGGLRH